jgi:hypothetical protein
MGFELYDPIFVCGPRRLGAVVSRLTTCDGVWPAVVVTVGSAATGGVSVTTAGHQYCSRCDLFRSVAVRSVSVELLTRMMEVQGASAPSLPPLTEAFVECLVEGAEVAGQ